MNPTCRFGCCGRYLASGKALVAVVMMVLFAALLLGRSVSNWDVPEAERNRENPHPATEESLKKAKEVYDQNCLFCHGETGAGDGQVAGMLNTKLPSFTDVEHMDKETDGELFWKMSTGKDPMPGFSKKLSAEEMWQLVNLIRSFVKQE